MSFQDTKKANKNTYNAIASKYEENYGVIPASNEFAEYILEEIKKIKNPRILDLGCGTGTLLKFFEDARTDSELTGVDFSQELLNISLSKLKNAKLICEDFASFETKDKYDVIIATFSLIHSTDEELEQMIPKIYSMLKDKGYFYVSFILGEGEKMEPEALDTTHKTYFNFHSEIYLTKLLNNNGFTILKQKIVHSQDEYENEDDIYFVAHR